MLPGSPRIVYRRHYIDYDFGAQRIRLRFIHPLHVLHRRVVTVTYDDGNPELLKPGGNERGHISDWVHRTGLPHAVEHVAHGTHAALDGTADRIHDAGEMLVAPVVRVFDATPLGSALSGSAADRATRERDTAVSRAAGEARRRDLTIPTLR
jgi:hypothetical protein